MDRAQYFWKVNFGLKNDRCGCNGIFLFLLAMLEINLDSIFYKLIFESKKDIFLKFSILLISFRFSL